MVESAALRSATLAAVRSAAPTTSCPADYRHEALFYEGMAGFLDGVVPFVRAGLADSEAVLVVVTAERIQRLVAALGPDAASVQFLPMDAVGVNPARIIATWEDFLEAHAAGGRRARGVGEPVHPGRTPAELAECHRHEALLNLAFTDHPGFWLLCPYDTAAIPEPVLAEARRTHPYVARDGIPGVSTPDYVGETAIAAPFADPLPEPAGPVLELAFTVDDLRRVRLLVGQAAERAGLPRSRRDDLVLAACEMATNSIRHGGGAGVLRVWTDGGTLLCEVRDRGRIAEPLVGRLAPRPSQRGGRGVWLANQLCDLVQIRAFADGGVVRLHMRL